MQIHELDTYTGTPSDTDFLAVDDGTETFKFPLTDAGMSADRIRDYFYPVGSYYETSDASFDPNSAWGGTWVLEAEGQVHIGAGSNYTIGDVGGEAEVTLTIDEMPSHTHNLPNVMGYVNSTGGGNGTFGAVDTWRTVGETGGGQPHNNMPPYIAVNRWHRTA